MTSENFVYWLQGLFELGQPEQLNAKQTALIKRHLDMVFIHDIDPKMGDAEHQENLTAAHEGSEAPPGKPTTMSRPRSSSDANANKLRKC